MNCFYKLGCRIFQKTMWCAMWFLPWNQNKKTLSGAGAVKELPKFLKSQGFKSILIVTDGGLFKLGMADPILAACETEGMKGCVYHDVVPNPTIGNIEDGLKMYKENGCDVIVALGGGSAMDCAKGIGARVARPNKTIPQMKGVLKVSKKLPPLVAIPTTSGTGSEATLAAVISNPETHEKYPINDPMLIPRYVVMDPELTKSLPKHITSTTGMDALTHAVEAYIGGENTGKTKKEAVEAVKLIHKYLKKAYDDGSDLEARNQMQQAAYLAGKAFTRAYVGYVHAVAHTLGGEYGVPHGLANAVILPYVLKAYGKSAHKKLAKLAGYIGIEGKNKAEKANKFIKWIEDMNESMAIPNKIMSREGGPLIEESRLPKMIQHAYEEANPLYPCPQVWGKKEIEAIYRQIM
ncbi:MAG: iron-containing alcohol dehydrogenase [Clostridia bacterium]|nr:iron-containing alcohol dehydrogenase [Clostridia bacterium]